MGRIYLSSTRSCLRLRLWRIWVFSLRMECCLTKTRLAWSISLYRRLCCVAFQILLLLWDNACYSCCGVTAIINPNSVTSIGDQAFYESSKLMTMGISGSMNSIGVCAFQECTWLTLVVIQKINYIHWGLCIFPVFQFEDCLHRWRTWISLECISFWNEDHQILHQR